MCAPALLTGLGMSAGTASTFSTALTIAKTAFSVISMFSDASSQNKAIRQQQEALNRTAALRNEALANQREEIIAKAGEERAEAARDALALQARVRVAQGEAGSGSGVSTVRLLRDADFQRGLQYAEINTNARNQLRQNELEFRVNENKRSTEVSALESRKKSVGALDVIGAGLTLAGELGDTFSMGTASAASPSSTVTYGAQRRIQAGGTSYG